MRFLTFGDREKPVILMLPGSFCPASSLEYLYSRLMEDYCIIVADYTGHFNSGTSYSVFSSRSGEAAKIASYLKEQQINNILMLYCQSMGAEVGIELLRQLIPTDIVVQKSFFDGAPCIKLSNTYKKFMFRKFKLMINMVRKKDVDKIIGWKFLNAFTNHDNEAIRPMLEAMKEVAPYIQEDTIRNEVECCYSFDFPAFMDNRQQTMYFFYAKEEKACKMCLKKVQKAYPNAEYQVVKGYGHLTFSLRKTDEYIDMLKRIFAL